MNPSTGTFISMDTYQGSIFDPTSLHKYLYANANPVMYIDPSGYSTENDLAFYQQAWLTIDEAVKYETELISSMGNEYSYDYQVMKTGMEIIHKLKNTGLEYALTCALEPYVEPNVAREIARGILTGLDIVLNARISAVNKANGISDENSNDSLVTQLVSENTYGEKIHVKPYWQEPNTVQEFTRWSDERKQWETSLVVSDDFGRIKYRIDLSSHGKSDVHTNPHVHIYEINTHGTKMHKYGIEWFSDDNLWFNEVEPPVTNLY